jgi:translocation and assembly module TamB
VGALARALGGAGAAGVFVLAAAGGVVVHLDVPAVRRAVVGRVDRLLAGALPGRVNIVSLGALGPGGVGGATVEIDDPQGVRVLRVEGLAARVDMMDLLRSLAQGTDVQVTIDGAAATTVEVNLDRDASGALRLERAFVPATPAPAPASPGPSRGVALHIGPTRLDRVTAHGQPADGVAIDAVVDGLLARLALEGGALRIDVDQARASGAIPGVNAAAAGAVEAHLEKPVGPIAGASAAVAWSGTVAGIPTAARGTYDRGALVAHVEVAQAAPEQLRVFWPACPLGEPASARVELAGRLPDVFVSGHAEVGDGKVDVSGPVRLDAVEWATVHVVAAGLDARSVAAMAPATRIDAAGDALVAAWPDGSLAAVLALQTRGTVGATALPEANLTASMQREAGDGAAITGEATAVVHEPGATATARATLQRTSSGALLGFSTVTSVPELAALKRFPTGVHGHVRASASGTVDLTTMKIAASIAANVAADAGSARLGEATLTGHASGPLADPAIDLDLRGEDLEVAALQFSRLRAGVHGTARGADVTLAMRGHDADLRLTGTVGVASGSVVAQKLHLSARRDEQDAHARASLVSVGPDAVRVDDIDVVGLGEALAGSVRASRGTVAISAHSRGLDLQRVARFAGIPELGAGRIVVDGDATLARTRADGRLTLAVLGATVGTVHDATARIDVTLEGRRATGQVSAKIGDTASLDVTSAWIEAPGTGALGAATLAAAQGAADVAAHVDLARAAELVPSALLPVRSLGGTVNVAGHVGRAAGTAPDLDLTARTTHLAASGPAATPWTLQGVDGAAHVRVEGISGATSIEAQAADAAGVLASVTARAPAVPYLALAAGGDVVQTLRGVAITGSLDVPPRDLAAFPAFLGTRDLHGEASASATWSGTADSPALDAHATLGRGGTDVAVLALPFDLDATAHYDGARLDATLAATSRKTQMLLATAGVDIRAPDLLASLHGASLPWKASMKARLAGFPLESLAVLNDAQVRGHVSGEVAVDGLHDDARASVQLSVPDLTVGEITCKSASAHASFDGQDLGVTTRIDESDGSLQATVRVGARWGAATTPSLDSTRPADVSLVASTFRAVMLQPLLSSVFAELDGRVDGTLQVHADRTTKTLAPQGTLRLSDGVFELASVGGEFHDASAQLSVTPDGVVKLEKASAQGLSGKIELAASARFDGPHFAGARGSILVPHQEPLPLVFDGVQVGMFDGQVGVDVDPAQGGAGLDVKVSVDKTLVQLPLASARTVQSLGALDGVRVGLQRPGQGFVARPLDGPTDAGKASSGASRTLKVTVALGPDLEIKRGTTLDVRLAGSPTVTVADDVRATGQVRLERGTIDVQGKTFTLQNGTVTFVDDPTNPQVVLTASWPAPDGTTIYADFVGPLKTGKVTLRADPPRTQNEILSLVLFGTTDEQTSSSTGATAQQSGAVGAAAGAATAPINQALGGVNQMLDKFGLVGGISTKVDTSQTTPRPEVELQIARDISIQVAWVLGVPPPGTNPDSTLFTLDWRFLRSWSLETTVGDAGTSILDLVWQHRY